MSDSLDMFRLEDGEEANKRNEEIYVMGYLGELEKYINGESYKILVKYFVEKDMENIAEVIKRLCTYDIELNQKIVYMKREIEKMSNENQKLKAKIKSLQEGAYNADKLRMKELYLSGMSLRAIAREFGCDHNAVKRKLRKMGVEIRK